MRVLDLFSGLGGWSKAFSERGHRVITVDINPSFKPSIIGDVSKLTIGELRSHGPFDVILASPPCECFSVASIGKHWRGGNKAYIPNTKQAEKAINLVYKTLELIKQLSPPYWYMENPRGLLRKIIGIPVRTVWYCQYGDSRAKPTDIWGHHAPMEWRPECHNGAKDHASAPRGHHTGTQGIKGVAMRSMIPYQLSLAVCLACEKNE